LSAASLALSPRNPNLSLVTPRREREWTDSNRRAHERLTVSELSWLNQVRLKYGPPVSLLDLSSGGAQIETTGHRLQPGSTVVIEIASARGDFAVPSRVLRCAISSITPQTTYRGALEFKRLLRMPDNPNVVSSETDVNPLHELARLTATLHRAGMGAGDGTAPARMTEIGEAALAAAQAVIESPAGRRAGEPFLRQTGRLVRMLTRAIEEREPAAKVVDELIDALRRSVPALNVRLIDASAVASQNADAIALDVCTPGSGTKLFVEFAQGRRLETWHLQLLKSAAHLFALTKDVERAGTLEIETPAPPADSASCDDLLGWHRVVARYVDGRVVKGYAQNFTPRNGHLKVWPTPECPSEERVRVGLGQLKAVFFVHDLDGTPAGAEPRNCQSEPGRRVVVTFADGEVMNGTTLNYSEAEPGFFMTPVGLKTNNIRAFVISAAVTRVQFP
jgi:hypothetical protein